MFQLIRMVRRLSTLEADLARARADHETVKGSLATAILMKDAASRAHTNLLDNYLELADAAEADRAAFKDYRESIGPRVLDLVDDLERTRRELDAQREAAHGLAAELAAAKAETGRLERSAKYLERERDDARGRLCEALGSLHRLEFQAKADADRIAALEATSRRLGETTEAKLMAHLELRTAERDEARRRLEAALEDLDRHEEDAQVDAARIDRLEADNARLLKHKRFDELFA